MSLTAAISRRSILATSAGLAFIAPAKVLCFGQANPGDAQERWSDVPDFPEKSPQLEGKIVKKYVIACHANLPVVKEMLAAYPGLLNASWDWGSGDFERGIEGAGHMGNHEIAEYLISKGARMNIFCAAMLGNLDFVKAELDVFPDALHSKGPHGFGLLHHANVGKEKSKPVLDYLEKLMKA